LPSRAIRFAPMLPSGRSGAICSALVEVVEAPINARLSAKLSNETSKKI